MSLLQNEDFIIYHLRTAYLQNINDGVGERLINVNTAILNDPSFRAAGWNPNPPELKRCYSPPIPTSGTSEYFKAPSRAVRLGESVEEEDEEGGMVTGRPSNEAVEPTVIGKRRRRRERERSPDDDDSSDLSDESNEETEGLSRPTNSVRFAKMPERGRSGSSPLREASQETRPSFFVTSPSKPPDGQELENADLASSTLGGRSAARKTRPRRDTTTSSEISSGDDPDRGFFAKRQIGRAAQGRMAREQIAEEESEDKDEDEDSESREGSQDDDSSSESDSLASDFSGVLADPSLLEDARPVHHVALSPAAEPHSPNSRSPARKSRPAPDVLQELPPPRPISTIQPISALSLALKGKSKKAVNPLDQFAQLSTTADQSPLYIKMYAPFAKDAETPMELFMKRMSNEGPVTVVQAIGFSLWKYDHDQIEPPLTDAQKDVNSWVLRNAEFGEVDFDFPALSRVRPMSDFTANSNRPPRPRARDKPWDEFALVEADDEQRKENLQLTPQPSEDKSDSMTATMPTMPTMAEVKEPEEAQPPPERDSNNANKTAPLDNKPSPFMFPNANPITDPRHAFASFRKDSLPQAQDLPTTPKSHAVERSGAPKVLNIRYVDNLLEPHVMQIQTTTDTYISEVFDTVCARLQLEKGLFVLKVSGTSTVAPADRTVEALGPNRSSLDLVRRRFVGEFGVPGSSSPGSTSPNAPLMLHHNDTLLAGRSQHHKNHHTNKKGQHPLAQQQRQQTLRDDSELYGGALAAGLGLTGLLSSSGNIYKRFNVIRRQPMSFTGNAPRTLAFDGEFLHIMPSETTAQTGRERMFEASSTKITTVHFSNVVGCKVYRKHPKMFRFLIYRERETKRYDFEAKDASEAVEIVDEIKKGMEPWRTV